MKVLFVDKSIDSKIVSSNNEALRLFKKNKYDLLVLDIMIPQDKGVVDVSKSGGIELIKSIQSLHNIYVPREIICITSEEKIALKYREELDKDILLFPEINMEIYYA